MKKQNNSRKDKTDEQIPLYERVYIVIFILLVLLALFLSGGNGQHWYPGQPFKDR